MALTPDGATIALAASLGMTEAHVTATLETLVEYSRTHGRRSLDWQAKLRQWLVQMGATPEWQAAQAREIKPFVLQGSLRGAPLQPGFREHDLEPPMPAATPTFSPDHPVSRRTEPKP